MKKKKLQNLSLNKKSISDLNVNGGFEREEETHLTYKCPKPNTYVRACSNHMCDSRLGGCASYYSPC